jgi:exonuclease SbcD
MLTGAVFSTGQCAVGEDLEFGLNDLQAAKCDAVMLGHVHKQQSWGNVAYSGSPGRLNFGEQEEKGFLLWTFDGGSASHQFIPSPARRFVFGDLPEWSGAENVYNEAICMARDCKGAFVRLRYVVPEEERQSVDRGHLEALFEGAASVKIEVQVIPKVRSRAAGISRVDSLPEKVRRWGSTVDIEIPDNVLALAASIEGKDADELLEAAMAAVSGAAPVVHVPADAYQADLFAEAA